LKILLAHCFFQQFGGQDAVVLEERAVLERQGHEVLFYSRHNDEIKSFTPSTKIGFASNTVWSGQTSHDLRQLVRAQRPDIAYIHNIYPLISPSIYHTLHACGVPMVQCMHDFRPLCVNGFFYTQGKCCERCKTGNYLNAVVRRCYKDSYWLSGLYALSLGANRLANMMGKISAFICLNEFYGDKLVEVGVARDKIFVRPNSIDSSNIVSLSPGESQNYAVYLGRLSPEKGLWTLVKAFEQIRSARLKIAGDGPMAGDLKRYILEKKLENIELVGFCRGEAKRLLLANASFAVLPSEWHENFPVVALEYYSAAKPIVASRMGSLPSIVANGESGLLFAAGDSADLASKVQYLFAHPMEVHRMGQRARELAETKYSRERNYEVLLRIFRKVLAAQSPLATSGVELEMRS
jgi:glycosyltransferase involved in cell wall biosynthesis